MAERLQRGAGVVDVAAPPAVAKLKPPSRFCWRASHDERPTAGATPAARSASTANAVRLTWPETEPSPRTALSSARQQITPAEALGRDSGRAGDEDRALERADIGVRVAPARM